MRVFVPVNDRHGVLIYNESSSSSNFGHRGREDKGLSPMRRKADSPDQNIILVYLCKA